MRLWTINPRYLDAKGLVAVWREGLLAQKILAGGTVGYRHHPQLARFRAQANPPAAIAAYLRGIIDEALQRGYQFDSTKISRRKFAGKIPETEGQLLYEWGHLKAKLRKRAPQLVRQHRKVALPEPHPLFRMVSGGVREWEKARGPSQGTVMTR